MQFLEPELQLDGLWKKLRDWIAGKKMNNIKTQAKNEDNECQKIVVEFMKS